MARGYPKFIYQKVSSRFGDEIFVVHLQHPRLVFKVHRNNAGAYTLECLDESCPEPLLKRATDWTIAQLVK